MTATIGEALANERIGFDELHKRYGPVLSMVDVLIGMVPHCDRYLEIWQPGFRTYNLVVPNFLNLPASLFGRAAPKDIVGLGMYASSRAASCMYCSAHTCSFALRRGSSADAVTGERRTPAEAATVAVAESLSTMPHHFDAEQRSELQRHLGAGDAEWVVMGVVLMGFLNKFMDAIGVDLEAESVDDVAGLIVPTGWSVGQHGWDDGTLSDRGDTSGSLPKKDDLATLMKVLRNAPGAVKLDRQWMDDAPSDPVAAREMIDAEYGWDEPALTAMRFTKPRRALTAALRHNLDPLQSAAGLGAKAIAGLVFATHAGSSGLTTRSEKLAVANSVDPAAIAVASDPHADVSVVEDVSLRTVITLARATAPSPAVVDAHIVADATAALDPDQIIELVVWQSVCQMIHRLSLWFDL